MLISYSASISWNPESNVRGGNQFVGLQSRGTGIEQVVQGEPNSNFYLAFDISYREATCAPVVDVYSDSQVVLTLTPIFSWQTLTLASDKLKFIHQELLQ